MKKTGLSILTAIILTSLMPSTGFAAERILPNSVEQAVGKIEAHQTQNFDETSLITFGSAAFVDHGGCFFTNSHAVVNLSSADHQNHPYFLVKGMKARGEEPQTLFEAEILYVNEEVDLAYGCPKDKDSRVFTNFFPRYKEDQFYTRSYGEEVWLGGYPVDGRETITISPGHIVGFLEQPDISDFGGLPNVNQSRLRLYKADSLAGPGISGGVAFTTDLKLLGLPFAGSFSPGGFVFLIGEQMYIDFEQEVSEYLVEEGLVPSDCILDTETGYYASGGVRFYDRQCEIVYDAIMEQELQQTYTILCSEELPRDQLLPAVRRVKQLGDATPWTELVLDVCKGKGSSVQQADTSGSIETGSAEAFAYGKQRLSSLEAEQMKAKELKQEIDEKYPQLKIHEDDWSTIVNSYIYGGYPLEAIDKAIEIGGYTVHPEIPFEVWSNSHDYQQWM